jgi:putative Ca2+/H+ antiporter (TMEM165/GDT1 family)
LFWTTVADRHYRVAIPTISTVPGVMMQVMASWVEVLGTAFLLQLLALPGEKGQLVVAALATQYDPYRVVAGAATAFAGWTAVEILVGEALIDAFPEYLLDALTATLFVGFAVLILYSHFRDGDDTGPGEPGERPGGDSAGGVDAVDAVGTADAADAAKEPVRAAEVTTSETTTDGGAAEGGAADGPLSRFVGRIDRRGAHGGYVAALSAMGVAEFGDKTQLVTIGLAVQYGAHPAIWVGEMLAIVPVSLGVAILFDRSARLLDRAWIHYAAAATFLLFAADIAAGYLLGFSLLPL